MKTIGGVSAALLAGLVIGSWGPRQDVKRLSTELEAARRLGGGKASSPGLDGVTQMLGISGSRSHRGGADAGSPSDTAVATETNAPVDGGGVALAPADGASNAVLARAAAVTNAVVRRDERRNMSKDIEDASELWRTRSAIARASFEASARLDRDSTVRFEALMDAMNLRLEDKISKWVTQVQQASELDQEAGVRLAREVTDTIVLTYDEMDRKLPGWRQQADSPLNLMDFIDPAVALPLSDIQPQLEREGGWGHHHGPSAGKAGAANP